MFQTNFSNIKDFLLSNEMYSIYGSAMLCRPLTIYVDSNSQPTSVCCIDGENGELTIYGNNTVFLDQVYTAFVRGKKVYFSATDSSVLDYFSTKRKIHKYTTCNTVVHTGGTLPEYSTKFRLAELRQCDYATVVAHHQYGGTLEEISYCAQNFPNAALFDGDKLVCWTLVHLDGSIGPLFTLPQYRGQGLAKVVLIALFDKMLKHGLLPYSYIVKGNTSSEALVDRCASRFGSRDVCWGCTK